jgi:hypothetical protein
LGFRALWARRARGHGKELAMTETKVTKAFAAGLEAGLAMTRSAATSLTGKPAANVGQPASAAKPVTWEWVAQLAMPGPALVSTPWEVQVPTPAEVATEIMQAAVPTQSHIMQVPQVAQVLQVLQVLQVAQAVQAAQAAQALWGTWANKQ